MSEIRVTSIVGENGGDRVGLTTGLTVGPLTGTTGIGATISHHGNAQFTGVCTATAFIPSQGQLSHRNLFVNGACRINQRGTVTVGSGYGGPDRWVQYKSGSGAAITSQDTDVPTGQGFRNSIKLDVSTALASGSSNWAWIGQYIEAQDVQSVCKGTSNAKQLTLQFWVKSPKTGTHTVRLYIEDTSETVGATYTVSSANTWEKKTVTFPASTSGGTINDDNGRGIQVLWVLSAGTTYSSGTLNTTWASWVNANAAPGQPNILDSTSNNFYLTGVQLEIGTVATPFEHKKFSEELAHCQRYCFRLGGSIGGDAAVYTTLAFGIHANATVAKCHIIHPVTMRDDDVTFTVSGITLDDDIASYSSGNYSSINSKNTSSNISTLNLNTANYGAGAGRMTRVLVSTGGGYIQGECEL